MKRQKTERFELPEGFKWEKCTKFSGEDLWVIRFLNPVGLAAICDGRISWSIPGREAIFEWDSQTELTSETSARDVTKVFYVDGKLAWNTLDRETGQFDTVREGKRIPLGHFKAVEQIDASLFWVLSDGGRNVVTLNGSGLVPVIRDEKPLRFESKGDIISLGGQPYLYHFSGRLLGTDGLSKTSLSRPVFVCDQVLRQTRSVGITLCLGRTEIHLPQIWKSFEAFERQGKSFFCLCLRYEKSNAEMAMFHLIRTKPIFVLLNEYFSEKGITEIILGYLIENELVELWTSFLPFPEGYTCKFYQTQSELWARQRRPGEGQYMAKFDFLTGSLLGEWASSFDNATLGSIGNIPVVCSENVANASL
jgi:hypothetical protein